MTKRCSSGTFDEKLAFSKALNYDLDKYVYVTPEMKKFLELKGKQHAVDPRMFIPGFLVATANAMGMAKVNSVW